MSDSKNIPKDHESDLSEGKRRFLYFTACMTGAVILIVEILGAKMLSPYLGTSHFVWTAQIAVTLVALSVGYFVGGWVVDRTPRCNRDMQRPHRSPQLRIQQDLHPKRVLQ